MNNVWVMDVETDVAGKDPDPRYDRPTMWGWYDLERTKWSRCSCPIYEGQPETVIVHHGMYDVPLMYKAGVDIRRLNIHDTMVAAAVSGYQDISLAGISQELFHDTVPRPALDVDPEQHLGQDLFRTKRLFDRIVPEVKGEAYDIDRRMIPMLVEASFRGYEVDHGMVRDAVVKHTGARDRAHRLYLALVGDGAPKISSPVKLAEHFGWPDVQAGTLRPMGTPLANAILQYRSHATLLNRYLVPMETKERATGLFNLTPDEAGEEGSGGGRLSSKDDNMQNQHPSIQRCLRAPDGFMLRRWDLPRIELAVAAELSQSDYFISVMKEGRDIHQETADYLRLGTLDGKYATARAAGKHGWNFPVLYGAEAKHLSFVTGRSEDWCESKLQEFRQGPWKEFFEWGDRHWATVQRTHYSDLGEPFGHRRYIPLLSSKHAMKQAKNHPVSGTAAYIWKRIAYEVWKINPLFVNGIHDEGHDYVPEDEDPDLLKRQVADIMMEVANHYLPTVGIKVDALEDVKITKYWEPKD